MTSSQQIHITQLMSALKFPNYSAFHAWSVSHYQDFWKLIIETLGIVLDKPYNKICDMSDGIENPKWLSGAKLNIVNSCFQAQQDQTAIFFQSENSPLEIISYGELNKLSNRVANTLQKKGFKPGDAIAIVMPMTPLSVGIYLGIIKAGCVVVGIAESFAPDEIATRLRISHAKAVFTQDHQIRNQKIIPLHEKVIAAGAQNILLPTDILADNSAFTPLSCSPDTPINILFSSGTTGEPKGIPWTQTTPIKCASDAYLHQNISPGDRIAWPSSLGWMMGPWLIFATLINKASMVIYDGLPTTREFGEFIQNTKTTCLGVVPSIVKTWRATECMNGLNWNAIKVLTSTGECSNPDDTRFVTKLAGNKPMIEYCGGTEIGGAYITNTVFDACPPSVLSTPALGLDFMILDTHEVALIPPSIGLSTTLLNQDHHKVYYAGMPRTSDGRILRRHGDAIEKLPSGFYRMLGRSDDTMNLGGIKISAVEIEQTISGHPDIQETAAVAVSPPDGGPSQLVIYAVPKPNLHPDTEQLKTFFQTAIKKHLNPLFKIHQVILIDALPRTMSNKVMRRLLRQ